MIGHESLALQLRAGGPPLRSCLSRRSWPARGYSGTLSERKLGALLVEMRKGDVLLVSAEIQRSMISSRTKEALARNVPGIAMFSCCGLDAIKYLIK